MKTKRTKRKNKYTELRAAIAAVRKVNKGLLAVLPQWPEGWGEKGCRRDDGSTVKENVAAFFRDHGQEAEEAIAAFLDARARFSFEEFPRNWPEVYYMVHSSRRIMWRLHRQHFPENELIHQLFHEEQLFFKSLTPTAQNDRSRAYWDLLRRFTGYSRNALKNLRKNVIRSLQGDPVDSSLATGLFILDGLKAPQRPNGRNDRGVSRFAGQTIKCKVKVPRGTPQVFTIRGTDYVITGQKVIDIIDTLLAAYDDHEGQFILLPKSWRSQFKRRGAPAFCQFIESERINNRYTGRARLIVS